MEQDNNLTTLGAMIMDDKLSIIFEDLIFFHVEI
jgi:hypothetical protein